MSFFTTKARRNEDGFFFALSSCLRVFVVGFCLSGVPAQAQTPAEVVDRAIKSHGGSDALAKLKAFEKLAKGKCTLTGPELDATYNGKLALPDRAIHVIEIPTSKLRTVIGLNGLTGWLKTNNDPPRDLAQGQYELMVEESWVQWLCTVAPLNSKGLNLKPADATQVDGQPAQGVRVSKDGRPDVTLYFNKANGLLVKAEARVKDLGSSVSKDWVFLNHRVHSGVQLPTKIIETQNGLPWATWSTVEYKYVDKFDPALFRKP